MSHDTVVVVTSGQWGSVTPAEYKDFADIIKDELEAESRRRQAGSERGLTVLLAPTVEEALEKFNVGGSGSLIFLSRSEASRAEEIAAQYPRLQVVLFTGLIPEGKVIYISKAWFSRELLWAIF